MLGKMIWFKSFHQIQKNDETPIADNLENNWRTKKQSKNKLRMNMKAILNHIFQKDVVTIIEDSSSDEDLGDTEESYHKTYQTLG